jgi:hypothetical protein
MDVSAARKFRERWQAVTMIEREELRAMTPEEHWRAINALALFARDADLRDAGQDAEMEGWLRWARLKAAG